LLVSRSGLCRHPAVSLKAMELARFALRLDTQSLLQAAEWLRLWNSYSKKKKNCSAKRCAAEVDALSAILVIICLRM